MAALSRTARAQTRPGIPFLSLGCCFRNPVGLALALVSLSAQGWSLEIRDDSDYLTFVLHYFGSSAMASAEKLTTTVSTKGQVILPSAIRQRREWNAGTRLTVEETPDGVLLKPAPAFAETRPGDVFGVLPSKGGSKTIAEMDAGILAEAKRRHARD